MRVVQNQYVHMFNRIVVLLKKKISKGTLWFSTLCGPTWINIISIRHKKAKLGAHIYPGNLNILRI